MSQETVKGPRIHPSKSKCIEEYVPTQDGGEIFVKSLGQGKYPLLVVHGGPDWDHSYLSSACEALATNRRVILFDIRGCGKSAKFGSSEFYTIDHIIEDIQTILKHLEIKVCDLLGFSFGGQVAMRFLAKKPLAVKRIILASSTEYDDFQKELDAWDEYQERCSSELKAFMRNAFQRAPADGQEPSRSLALETLSLDVYNLERLDAVRTTIEQVTFSCEWIKAFRAGAMKAKRMDFPTILNASQKEVLIIHGEKDMRFPVSCASQLHAAVKNSSLAILENTGHLAHLESHKAWVDAIDSFLS